MADLLSVHGAVDEDEMRHLAGLALQVCDGCIVEVGAFRGRSTAALAMGSMMGSHAPVYAIDPQETFVGVYGGEFGSEDRGSFFESMVRLRLYPIVRLVNLSSEWLSTCWPLPVRLLWVDGDHRYAGVRRDIDCWLPKLHDDATIVFDDAVDQEVGPYHVIEQLTADGVWTRGETIGKTVTLFRGAGCAG
jgi:hypothetical protein